jgi:GT2 family glycosyltransferase
MKASHKVSIGFCDPGTVNGDFAARLYQLAAMRNEKLGPMVRIKGSGLLSKMRNRIVKMFLENTESDWLLMIDSDEQLTVQTFDLLVDTAHDKERPIVSGLVFAAMDAQKNLYPKPMPTIFQDVPEGFIPLDNYDRNAIFQVEAAGTGCLLIHRSVLEKMREVADPHQGVDWCWFWDGPVNGVWTGEDLLFSRRVRQLGFPIYVNTAAILPHQKQYWLDERHHLAWQEQNN